MQNSLLTSLLRDFRDPGLDHRILIVSRSEPIAVQDSEIQWLSRVVTADDIPDRTHADLGLVFNQLEDMERSAGTHLLARMRDQFCRKVLVATSIDVFTGQEMLSLGYIGQPNVVCGKLVYQFDPEIFFEKRSWNTPDGWAHPGNFNKTRW